MSSTVSGINTKISNIQTITNALNTINTGTNGYYIKLSNGLVIAFGQATISSVSATGHVSCPFNIAYTFSNVYSQSYSGIAASDITSHIAYASCAGSRVDSYIYKTVGSTTVYIRYIVIGV